MKKFTDLKPAVLKRVRSRTITYVTKHRSRIIIHDLDERAMEDLRSFDLMLRELAGDPPSDWMDDQSVFDALLRRFGDLNSLANRLSDWEGAMDSRDQFLKLAIVTSGFSLALNRAMRRKKNFRS